MRKLLFVLMMMPLTAMAQTLEQCQQAAQQNYPLLRQYDLISKTTGLTVANLQKGWLPQVSASAQATYQSDVMAWPEQMQTMISQMGVDLKGLRKDQYRVGIDINQTVFDGGTISSQKAIARQQGVVEAAQTEVDLYALRLRMNELYFGWLLVEDRISLNNDLQTLLRSNEEKLASMLANGTAAESDYHAVKAERLQVEQQLTELKAQRQALQRMLELFCGMSVTPVKPVAKSVFNGDNLRPELRLLDARLQMTDVQEKALRAGLMPRLSIFAQGYYGYPGYNMFEDMLRHDWSLNGMVGARLTWNIGALYMHKNDRTKLSVQRSAYEVQRETFLFNNQLEQIQQQENISRYEQLMAADDEIIALRQSVRQAAESKLAHGIIDVNDLLREINSENAARTSKSIHEIELLKEIYDLKYTTNN